MIHEYLPAELIQSIAHRLDTKSRIELAKTCKQIYQMLIPEISVAKSCWHNFPECASLNSTNVDWIKEMSYWETVRSNWQTCKRAISTLTTGPSDPSSEQGPAYLNGDQLFVRVYKTVENTFYNVVEVWDLITEKLVFDIDCISYGVSQSYFVAVQPEETNLFTVCARNDFKGSSCTLRFPFTAELDAEFTVEAMNDRFVAFSYNSGILIHEIPTGAWAHIDKTHYCYVTFGEIDVIRVCCTDARPYYWRTYEFNGISWQVEFAYQPLARYHHMVTDKFCKVRNPDVFMCSTENDSAEVFDSAIKTVDYKHFAGETFEMANSHAILTQHNHEPGTFLIREQEYVDLLCSMNLKDLKLQLNDIHMSEKYLVIQIPDYGRIAIYDFAMKQPREFTGDPNFGWTEGGK